jgi:hypothetical protein
MPDALKLDTGMTFAGRVGFGYDMGATKELEDATGAQHALEIADDAAKEVERRWAEPYRKYRWWSRVRATLSSDVTGC